MRMKHLYYSTAKQLHQALGGVFPHRFSFLVSISHCISHYHILFITGVSSTGEPWKQTPAQLIANKSHIGGFILAEKHNKNRVCV